jgi:hypothetical protein
MKIDANLIVNWASTSYGLSLDIEKSRSIDHDAYLFFDIFDENRFRGAFEDVVVTSLDNDEMKRPWQQVKGVKSFQLSQGATLKLSDFQNQSISPIYYDITNPYRFLGGDSLDKDVASYFNLLPLHPAVSEALADVTSQLNLSKVLCLHVRRGDLMNVSDLATALKNDPSNKALRLRLLTSVPHLINRYAPYHAYESAIKELGGSKKIVVVMSDDEEVKRKFVKNYGERCLDYKSILDRHQLTNLQRDFVEFLIIAQSGQILGTESAFVDFSAKVGGKYVNNVLAFIDVPYFIEEIKHIFRIDAVNRELLIDILELYIASFSRRRLLDDKKKQLESHIYDLRGL